MPTLFQAQANAPSNARKPAGNARATKSPLSPSPQSTIMKPLTAFALNPAGVRFETQEPEETVVLFLRQHIVVNVPWIVITIILILAPTVIFPFFSRIVGLSLNLPVGYTIVGALFWYVATFGYALANFIGWFFNIYIVTNERVVDIDFYYLLYKEFSQAELTKIQDISYTSGGIIATIFNFGNVAIETAGEAPNLVFEAVPFPERIVETIRSLTENTGTNV